MNPQKKSGRCRASASIQALDLAISRFIYSFDYNVLSASSYTDIYVRDLYISRIGLSILLQPNMRTDPGNI
jgi:hypothetical protein